MSVPTSTPMLLGPASTLKSFRRLAAFERLQGRLERRGDAVVHLDIADRHRVREQDRAALDVVLDQAFDDRLAADRRRGGVLAGVADVAAVVERPIEGIGGGDDDALFLELLDDVVIGADLRRRHDDAVDGGVVDDLVEDLDFARDVVDRRFRAELDQVDAEGVGGDLRADIDRIEEAVAGGMGDDRESERLAVLLGGRGFLRRVLERIAADRLVDRARLGESAGPPKTARRNERRNTEHFSLSFPPGLKRPPALALNRYLSAPPGRTIGFFNLTSPDAVWVRIEHTYPAIGGARRDFLPRLKRRD